MKPQNIDSWFGYSADFLKFQISYLTRIKFIFISAAAKSLQSCPTLCDPIDGSPLGSSVLGILQARTLEWVAISFSIFISKESQILNY